MITGSRREVTTLSRHSRKPRRPSRFVIVLQAGLAALQLCVVLIEIVDAMTRLLADLW